MLDWNPLDKDYMKRGEGHVFRLTTSTLVLGSFIQQLYNLFSVSGIHCIFYFFAGDFALESSLYV